MKGKNDISDDTFSELLAMSKNKLLLHELSEISRSHFDFFTKHTPRAFEYVWLIENITKPIADKKILDVGAGLNPLPLYLASQLAQVYTVDNSSFVRDPSKNKSEWNEWGYYPYSLVNPNIQSHNVDINELDWEDELFDIVYSISVIEHVPATARRALFNRLAKWTKPGGEVLLTIDLYKGQQNLWNYNYGAVVEDVSTHGNLENILHELRDHFILQGYEVLANIPKIDHIDIAMMKLIKK